MDTIERMIVRKLIRECKKAGFVPVKVWDSEEYQTVRTEAETIEAVNSVDDSTIHFAPVDNLEQWGRTGVYIVLGNGVDCISDYHCGNAKFEEAIEAASEYAETL